MIVLICCVYACVSCILTRMLQHITRTANRPVVGISLIAMAVGGGGIEINPHSPPSDDEINYACTAEPKARQRKGLDNLSVSSRPRVPNYAIGRDTIEEKSEPRVLRVSTAIYQQDH